MADQQHPPVPVPEPHPWRAEFTVAGNPEQWYTNAQRFPDREQALDAARRRAFSWTAVTRWRAADDSVPLSQPYEEGSEDGSWS